MGSTIWLEGLSASEWTRLGRGRKKFEFRRGGAPPMPSGPGDWDERSAGLNQPQRLTVLRALLSLGRNVGAGLRSWNRQGESGERAGAARA